MKVRNKTAGHKSWAMVSPRRFLCSSSLTAVALLALSAPARADDLYWDANGSAPTSGGSGTWNTVTQAWSQANSDVLGPYQVWNNAALNNAFFGLTAAGTTTTVGTVTVAEPITVHNMTFQTVNGWILNGGTITLGGVAPTITTSGNTTINSVLAGTSGLVKAGTAQLYLTGANTFSGGITINAGTLRVSNDAALGAAGNNITTAAGSNTNLTIESGTTNRTLTLGTGSAVTLGGGATSAQITGDGRVTYGTGTTISNDSNSYTGTTTFVGCNGVCNMRFSSVRNLGEASSLGAPTTVANGTIIFNQQSQYSDNLIYIGDGDSSNRNWDINGNGAVIRNDGTGTLTLTGDVDSSNSMAFTASTADFELLGTLTGASFTFNGTAGRTITLGGNNTFAGNAGIGTITVLASKLSDAGTAGSLGAGTGAVLLAYGGALSYTGTGDSSNRGWTIGGASGATGSGTIRNDGTGALALSGAVAFGGAANNNLTLGGSFTGTNTLSGVISGNGNIVGNGSGTWVLSGASTRSGTLTVESGTLRAESASAFGTTTGITVNGGTLDLNGFNLTAPTLNGTGGTIALGANPLSGLTINGNVASSYAGSLTGAGGLTKLGGGVFTLTGANSFTGTTNIGGGTLALDFSGTGGPASDIIASGSALVLSGGSLRVTGAAGEANSQSFNGLTVTAGANTVRAEAGAGGSLDLNLGAITRTGGLVNFVLGTDSNITTSNLSLGGWATVNGTDYAKVVGGNIVAFEEADYTDKDDASTWANGEFISDSDGDAESFFGTVGSDVQLGGLQFTTPDATTTVTIADGVTLGVDGAIIVAPSVLANNQTVTGGNLTGATGGAILGIQQNGGGLFTVASTIVDNAGTVGFTKGGTGTVRLTGANTYTGVTTLSGGRLEIASLAAGGAASAIGASSAASSNLVLEGGTLAYVGGVDGTTDRGFTLVNGGAGAPAIEVGTGRTVTFSGLVTSPDDAGLTKTGAGKLVLSNGANDYVGVTTVSGANSTLSVGTLANGGLASGIGASSNASSNLVLEGGGRLEYSGGTAATDRGFTVGTGGGRISVSQAASTLTVSGTAIGTGGLIKDGDGTLILSGTNTYTGNNVVTAGVLRAGSAQAFGSVLNYMTVNSGARLELGGFNVTAAAVAGGGTIDLGANTLTTAAGPATFTGRITGTGGFTRGAGGYTQTINGCNNDYTGVTTISGGLAVDCIANGGQASAIGASSAAASNLVFAGGTLAYTGASVSTNRGFTLTGNGGINVTNAATTLEFSGAITGGGQLAKDGAGTLLLSGTNSSTGNLRIYNGTVRTGSTTALGSGWILVDDTAGVLLDLDGYDNSVFALGGGGALGGNIALGGATLTITNGGSFTAANFGGALTGNGSLIKNGGSTQQLSGCASSYDGPTVINAGILAVACLDDGGVNSSIGASSAAAGNLVLNGGTLQYVGAGGSTNRQFTLGASATSKFDASGTGTIAFTHAGPITFASANTAQTLTLGGTNTGDNIFAAQITNNGTGVTRLTKADAGTWVLTNQASTYTGVTSITGGVLAVDKLADGGLASSIGSSSNAAASLTIGSGGTLRYTGTGDTTDRRFTLGIGTTAIESSGSGAVVFSNTAAVAYTGSAARVVSLGGTNTGDNVMGATIGNQNASLLTSLAKNDTGRWILTGTNTYTGSTNINAGSLILGNGGTAGSIASGAVNNFGLLGFNRSDTLTYAGIISQTGTVEQLGTGTTILTGSSTYSGGTTISAGRLQLGNGGTTGSIVGNVVNDGAFAFNRSNSYVFAGAISGSGVLEQIGSGTTILTGASTYTGGTTISAGTLQIGNGGTTGSIVGDVTNNATLAFNRSNAITFGGTISGTGALTKAGAGSLILTGANTYTGGTTISAGALQLGDGGTSGSITGNITNNSSLIFNRSDNVSFGGLISGTGSVTLNGPGVVALTANNSYAGSTTANAGTLLINGNQSAATGLTTINSGATLGGNGTIGGNVTIANGGVLASGNEGVGTLSIAGNLSLSGGSVLNFEFGQADVVGGALNDLVNVGGNLVLDGTINVSVPAGGAFGGGIYRVFNYGGTLTDNGLTLGLLPAGSDVTIQTSVAGQVNLLNADGLSLSFWDGNLGPKLNNTVDGGNGTWHLGGSDNNWTNSAGSVNAAYSDGTFAIFAGTGGTVTVDNTGGDVTASGMQFASNGYTITGDPLTLVGAESMIRVGDGTALGAGFTATVAAAVSGASTLVKTDLGTLVLTGANTYTGGTAINGGTLRIASDANLGAVAGSLSFNGGTLNTTANMTTGRAVTLTGAGTLLTNPSTTLMLSGVIDGAGSLTKSGTGTLVLTGNATHTGGTTIAAGALQIGNGGTTGSIVGNIVNNGALTFNRSDDLPYTGAISGTGTLIKRGAGVLTLTGESSYGGATTVAAGTLRLQAGGQINGTSVLTVNSGSQVIVEGIGSRLAAGPGQSIVGWSTGTGTLIVRDGGTASFGDFDMANSMGTTGTVTVTGAGSQLSYSGTGYFGRFGTATLNITDGGRVLASNAYVGSQVATGLANVTVSGADSEWAVANGFFFRRGTVTIADGGVVTAGSATIAFVGAGLNAPLADMIVTGAGSRFETTGALEIANGTAGNAKGSLTIADGGVVRVGSGTLALGLGDAVLNIGSASPAPGIVDAGTLDAANISFAAATNRVNFNHVDTDYVFGAAMSGAGSVWHNGTGTTILTADNAYTGSTSINFGTLIVNGDQSATTGITTVSLGGTLGGTGVIGGSVVSSGRINPGDIGAAPGALTINGALTLTGGAHLDFNFGQANVVGGAYNDLIEVGGDLTLEGTLNVQTSAGGTFDPGIYRVISYSGSLTDNGLAIGTIPSPDFFVQTSIANQVNLVNTSGLVFRYWDGLGAKNDGIVDGGSGLWQNTTGNDNWVDDGSIPNAQFADSAFAVFAGAAGTVQVDESLGPVNAAGMQFLTDGYVIEGDAITLTGSEAVIRVGDGTAAGAGTTATMHAQLTGAARLVKSDLGALTLSGDNTYMGGTAINGGVLQIATDGNLGDAAGGISFDGGTLRTTVDLATDRAISLNGAGALLTDGGTTLALTGEINGAGSLTKNGTGTLILKGTNSYAGGTAVNAGALFVDSDQTAATGLTSVASGASLGGMGVIGGDVAIADGATLDPGAADGLPGALSIGGNLSLASGARLSMQFGEANAIGGALNDLINVSGDLVLDGTLDVNISAGGDFGPGIYRVFNYGGTLVDNGLTLGALPSGGTGLIQTSITGQVNLVNTDGLALNFWDGAAGPKFNALVDGGNGIWQSGNGNDNWTDAGGTVNAGYADGGFAVFAGTGGNVTIDNSLGDVTASGLQFAADGYEIGGQALTLSGPQATVRVGDGSAAGAGFTATISAEVIGATQLVKTDAGTLVLSGANSYTGGTAIQGGTLAISTDANLGASVGNVSIGGGTLRTTDSLASDRAFTLAGNATILTDQATAFTLNGLITGNGALTKDGAGTLRLTGDNSGYAAATRVTGGALAVDGALGSVVDVATGGRLEGTGRVGGIANAGVVAPGNSIGTLTVAGDYVGNGGTLEIEAVLGNDSSAADRLVVAGATSGNTQVTVINRGGPGAQTTEGIKIVDVAGSSNGTFALNGDYVFQGEQTVVVGAYGYRLYKGGVADPADGYWYLRSGLSDPGSPQEPQEPNEPQGPLYQPGIPVYEAYGANLQALNGVATLQQRIGSRSWAAGANSDGSGIWGRIEGTRNRANAAVSTSRSDQNVNSWKMQLGVDRVLAESAKGERLVAGITAHYGQANSRVRSFFGNGSLETDGYGLGATLTWYGLQGFYVDGQAQVSWYDSDLESSVLGKLARGNDGRGEAFSVEVGKLIPVGGRLSVTPQIQTAYSNVRFDRFLDPVDAIVASDKGDSLKTRWGVSLDHQKEGESGRSHVYGIVNLNYEWLDGSRVRVSDTPISHANERLWGELGLGASVAWKNGVTLYGEVSGNSPFKDFGDSYSLKANAGVRVVF